MINSGTDVVTPESRKRACVHEAGHGLGAVILRIRFAHVWVASIGQPRRGKEYPDGRTDVFYSAYKERVERAGPRRRGQLIRNMVASYLFGNAAEEGPPPAEYQPDAQNALKWASCLNPGNPRGIVEKQYARALSLCSKHRTAITRVAATLWEDPTGTRGGPPGTYLNSHQIRKLMRG